jgi:bacteriocin biosynthesis cyclodehydratase domain-containing protein
MSNSDATDSLEVIRFKDVYGVIVLSPDNVEFRTGSMSGTACVVSDPERRGLLGPIIERLLSSEAIQRRPWNEAERELLQEVIPQLQQSGVVETTDQQEVPGANWGSFGHVLRKPLAEARIALVGHGVLGEAVRLLLTDMPCGSITVIESSSVATTGDVTGSGPLRRRPSATPEGALPERSLSRPRDAVQWAQVVGEHDWIIAAQDCFEPEELTALNKGALQSSVPWSLVCFDGYEGWVGPTFVPGQTACFGCFARRLFAGAAEPKHIFMDPGVKVYRVPSPWSAGPETGAWVSLLTAMFALELIAAMHGRSFTLNHMLVVHRLNLTFQRESVLRLPRCPDCAPRGDAPAANVFSHVLSTREKRE